jgi:NAD(P) transhydrogenase
MTLSERFDLVVIGSGPGGEKGAGQAAYFGKKTALVEKAPAVGGASVHTGTLPSKSLRETALYLTGFHRRALYGMTVRLDRKRSLRQLIGRLNDVKERQVQQILRNIHRHGITLVSGFGRFEDDHTLAVYDSAGGLIRRLTAEVFLVATGSTPIPPRGIAVQDPDVVDSDRILDLDRVPSSLTVVGGGVIGTEYACLFAALGTRITLVEGRDRLLGGLDEELSTAIQLSLERMGTRIMFGDAVESIERLPERATNALRLRLRSGRQLRADKVLFSAGRAGNTKGMNLEAIGVGVNDRGQIQVDGRFQTAVPHIYAVGDVIGFPALAATSMEQGRVAMCHAFQIPYKTAVSPYLPYGIYSIPEISTIGPSERELREKGVPYEIGRARFENNARGQITGDTEGFVKLLFDPETRKLLGVHILGEHATELIHAPMFVMANGGSIDAFIDAVFNFPSLSESFKYAAYDGLQRLARRNTQGPQERTPRVRSLPATRAWFVGAALGGSTAASAGRPVTVCVMDRWRRCRLATWSYDASGHGLLPPEVEPEGFVLALAPAALPPRELLANLKQQGLAVLGEAPDESAEVLLAATEEAWKIWSRGLKLRRPTLATGRRQRYEILRAQGLELPVEAETIHHDQVDAAAAAYLGYLWATGQASVSGARVGPAP